MFTPLFMRHLAHDFLLFLANPALGQFSVVLFHFCPSSVVDGPAGKPVTEL